MYCKNCGNEINGDYEYCPVCGSKKSQASHNIDRSLLIQGIVTACLSMTGLAGFIMGTIVVNKVKRYLQEGISLSTKGKTGRYLAVAGKWAGFIVMLVHITIIVLAIALTFGWSYMVVKEL